MHNRLLGLALGVVAIFTVPQMILFAQTARQPETAKVQPSAPTPDLSGIWTRLRDAGASALGYPSLTLEFSKAEPPMTPWAEAKYKANKTLYRYDPKGVLSDPVYSCYPPGLPRIYLQGFPMQIVQIPGQVLMLFEYDHFVRRIYTDGRPHDMDQGPLWMGDSIGRWEGDTLVTDTLSFNDKTLIDRMGHPHSDALHLAERIRRINKDNLEIDLTIDDSKAFTKPWGTKLVFNLKPDWKIMEQVCEDNGSFLDFNNKATQTPSK
jgi:hypothetical protein